MKIKENKNMDDILDELNINIDFYVKRNNGLILKDSQIKILEKYYIFYQNYPNLSSLLFEIETVLNEVEAEDLEKVSMELSEQHYYRETNK